MGLLSRYQQAKTGETARLTNLQRALDQLQRDKEQREEEKRQRQFAEAKYGYDTLDAQEDDFEYAKSLQRDPALAAKHDEAKAHFGGVLGLPAVRRNTIPQHFDKDMNEAALRVHTGQSTPELEGGMIVDKYDEDILGRMFLDKRLKDAAPQQPMAVQPGGVPTPEVTQGLPPGEKGAKEQPQPPEPPPMLRPRDRVIEMLRTVANPPMNNEDKLAERNGYLDGFARTQRIDPTNLKRTIWLEQELGIVGKDPASVTARAVEITATYGNLSLTQQIMAADDLAKAGFSEEFIVGLFPELAAAAGASAAVPTAAVPSAPPTTPTTPTTGALAPGAQGKPRAGLFQPREKPVDAKERRLELQTDYNILGDLYARGAKPTDSAVVPIRQHIYDLQAADPSSGLSLGKKIDPKGNWAVFDPMKLTERQRLELQQQGVDIRLMQAQTAAAKATTALAEGELHQGNVTSTISQIRALNEESEEWRDKLINGVKIGEKHGKPVYRSLSPTQADEARTIIRNNAAMVESLQESLRKSGINVPKPKKTTTDTRITHPDDIFVKRAITGGASDEDIIKQLAKRRYTTAKAKAKVDWIHRVLSK